VHNPTRMARDRYVAGNSSSSRCASSRLARVLQTTHDAWMIARVKICWFGRRSGRRGRKIQGRRSSNRLRQAMLYPQAAWLARPDRDPEWKAEE
jgi:hypothetical protein